MAAEFVPAVAERSATGLGSANGHDRGNQLQGRASFARRRRDAAPSAPASAAQLRPVDVALPDTGLGAAAGPLGFSPWTQGLTWRAIRTMTSSDRGLRLMMSTLSTLPVDSWWQRWTPADRRIGSGDLRRHGLGVGFVTDLRQGAADRACYHQAVLRSVPCPTLVTASRHDRGVSFEHAQDFVRTVPKTHLIDTNAPCHFTGWAPRRSISGSTTSSVDATSHSRRGTS